MTATTVPTTSAPFSALQSELLPPASALRVAITQVYRRNEVDAVQWLLSQVNPHDNLQKDVAQLAHK